MKIKILLILIFALSLFLRLFRLGEFPATLYGDEQAFAYNAYSILMTGKDEYGVAYPLQFRSFDDYKAPVPVYLLVPFIKILGLNNFAVRLPIALASIISVLISFYLARLFFNPKTSLTVSFLFAISPWHVHLSRGYFEATLSLLFFIAGIYFFLAGKNNLKLLLLGMIFFALSIYSYFTPRILLPFFIVFLMGYSLRFKSGEYGFRPLIKKYAVSLVFLILICSPMIYTTFFGQGLSRFNKLSDTNNRIVAETVMRERNTSMAPSPLDKLLHNKLVVRLRLMKNNYLEHFSANFWYIYGDNSLRYFTGNMGMFYLFEFPFLVIGLYFLWKEKRPAAVFFTGWLLLAPIPAALVGRSFAVRSLAMLPAPFMFVAYGIIRVINFARHPALDAGSRYYLRSGSQVKPGMTACVVIAVLYIISLASLLIRYYFEYPIYAATWWGWENKKAIDYTKKRVNDFDYIFLSDFYTGMPLAFAYYNRIDPRHYRQAVNNPVYLADGRKMIRFGKFYIGSLDLNNERLKKGVIPPRSMYLGRPEEPDSGNNITAPDDRRVIFRVFETK